MRCPRCQHENAADAVFCDECGARLEAVCSGCGESNRSGAKFCRKCGHALSAAAPSTLSRFHTPQAYTPKHLAEKILNSKAVLEGERKQVTVLFADLKGSMELLADRDPEEARKILDPVLERMMEAVHRYEGTVNQVMGDGIMALFGAPVAHEDHAVRACYAALRMQEAVGRYADDLRRHRALDVQIRVGLNSGEVVVRSIGSDLHMDYTAVGQTTHLAARMEQLARPATTFMTADTLRQAEGYVQVKPMGPMSVKGLGEPIEVHELISTGAARTRLQAAAIRGLTRFVGRDAEIDQLRRVQQLVDAGHGQVAAIVGEAGVGKSRLIYEFTDAHRLQNRPVLEGGSVSYGKGTSYLPVINLLKSYFKIEDRDGLREIPEKVMRALLTLDRSLAPILPPLLALLDAPVDDVAWQTLDPGQRRQRTLDAVKRLLLREARAQPLLVIFEDLHWIDSETQALLDSLVESLGSAPLLLLVTYRPEYGHSWGGKTFYSQLRLDALAAERADELLRALLGEDPGLASLKQRIVRRGNPFFLEETVRTLVETKALVGEPGHYRLTQPLQTIQVAPTVQAMLAARIDRLAPEDKRLLQVASVVGKDVPLVLLQEVADLPDEALRHGLDRLQTAEFLYEIGLYPDLEYTFKHALTHEVTYGGLLQDRRRELHARIVDAIERLHRDRLAGEIERLAHHALLGELGEKAVEYLRQAGRKTAARSALPDAQGWFEQAISVLETLPESEATITQAFDIRLELRPVLLQLSEGRQMLARVREAEVLAERLNDDSRRGRTYAFMTITHVMLGELDEALVAGTRALEIAGRLGDLRLRILTTDFLANAHYLRGEYERAAELATDNLAALPTDWTHEYFGIAAPPSVWDRAYLAMSLAQLGRFADAGEHEAEAIRLAEPMHHAFTVGAAHYAAGTLHPLKGDWVKARALLEHAIAVVRAGDVIIMLSWAIASSAWVLAQLGEAHEALTRLQEGEQLVEHQTAKNVVSLAPWIYHALGRAALLLDQPDEAQRLASLAFKFSSGHHGYTAHVLHLLGDIAMHPDRVDAERGEGYYRQALALAEPRGMRPLVAHCHLGLGNLYRRTAKPEQTRHFAIATAMCREMDMQFWLPQAQAAMDKGSR